jgi:hypothetical protein
MMRLEHMKTREILASIEVFQAVQKANKPGTYKWDRASEQLARLFAEMARRTNTQKKESQA